MKIQRQCFIQTIPAGAGSVVFTAVPGSETLPNDLPFTSVTLTVPSWPTLSKTTFLETTGTCARFTITIEKADLT